MGIQLHMKKTKVMTAGKTANFTTGGKVVDHSFCLLKIKEQAVMKCG